VKNVKMKKKSNFILYAIIGICVIPWLFDKIGDRIKYNELNSITKTYEDQKKQFYKNQIDILTGKTEVSYDSISSSISSHILTETNKLRWDYEELDLPSNKEVDDIVMAYGYLYGQDYSLNKIKKEYPELKNEILISEAKFNLSFRKSKERIINKLNTLLGSKKDEVFDLFENKLVETLSNQTYTIEDAVYFIQNLTDRAEGIIESPILEMLLTYQFIHNPVKEMTSDYTKKYSSNNHFKSKGLDFTIRVPKSWSMEEAERPNIVQKFTSENGEGEQSLKIMVYNLPDEIKKMGVSDKREYFESMTEKDFLTDEDEFISFDEIKLDNIYTHKMVYISTMNTQGMKIKNKRTAYITYYDDKLIMLDFHNFDIFNDNKFFDGRYNLFEPLVSNIANSLVILNQWEN
jgi:hypothetical protein